jgi:hypothetical protein
MEASERQHLSLEGGTAAGCADGHGRLVDLRSVDAKDDARATGFLRLHLMVNAVFERLTKP